MVTPNTFQNFGSSVNKMCIRDRTCYALSLGSNAPMMVYDKEIVEQAGVELPEQLTIEELYLSLIHI